MATRRRLRRRTRRKRSRRAWLLVPAIILAVMLGWLYRIEIVNLATFRFSGIDFSRQPAGTSEGVAPITEKERRELEGILKNR